MSLASHTAELSSRFFNFWLLHTEFAVLSRTLSDSRFTNLGVPLISRFRDINSIFPSRWYIPNTMVDILLWHSIEFLSCLACIYRVAWTRSTVDNFLELSQALHCFIDRCSALSSRGQLKRGEKLKLLQTVKSGDEIINKLLWFLNCAAFRLKEKLDLKMKRDVKHRTDRSIGSRIQGANLTLELF